MQRSNMTVASGRTQLHHLACFLFGGWLTITAGHCDDGGISFGGSPYLLSASPTIAMKNEIVKMTVGKERVDVDCNFLFSNSGDAAKVRMGFPDEGDGSEDPSEYGQAKGPVRGTFLTYKSYVDGKPVSTRTVKGKQPNAVWHTKTVSFAPKAQVRVRDVYSVGVGAQVTANNGMYKQTSYVIHTASSWKPPLEQADIIVTFKPEALGGKAPVVKRLKQDLNKMDWSKVKSNECYYEGFGEPKVNGYVLTFSKKNFKPSKSDDIHLYFGYRPLQ